MHHLLPGKPALLLGAFDIATLGYVAQEFLISGTASSYTPVGDLGPDGRWSVAPSSAANFITRMVVLTPADRAQFNGTVLVEWLNVSGGIDAPAVWMMAHREIVRARYAYVAVSAQRVGVEGGTNLMGVDMSLKSQDPVRYSSLRHPGDAYAYDIFSNAIDPWAQVYDGFLVHSRFGPAAPLDGGSIFETIAASRKRLYPGGAADYLERFTAALDSAIQCGFILNADREEILQIAAASFTGTAEPG